MCVRELTRARCAPYSPVGLGAPRGLHRSVTDSVFVILWLQYYVTRYIIAYDQKFPRRRHRIAI